MVWNGSSSITYNEQSYRCISTRMRDVYQNDIANPFEEIFRQSLWNIRATMYEFENLGRHDLLS